MDEKKPNERKPAGKPARPCFSLVKGVVNWHASCREVGPSIGVSSEPGSIMRKKLQSDGVWRGAYGDMAGKVVWYADGVVPEEAVELMKSWKKVPS